MLGILQQAEEAAEQEEDLMSHHCIHLHMDTRMTDHCMNLLIQEEA